MDPALQIRAARETLLAVASLDRVTLVVTGRDRIAWLNGLVTCDLLKVPAGCVQYGLFVGRTGRVLADAELLAEGSRVLLSVPASASDALRQHLDHHLVMEDAEVAVQPFDAWWLHGPKSGAAWELARDAGAAGGPIDRTGLGGALIFAAVGSGSVERSVEAVGGTIADASGWEALRLERAVPKFGVDFDESTYPQEAAIEKAAVSFDKGCYLGQEVVFMLEKRGHVKRRLSALVIEAGAPPNPGADVLDEAGAAVGAVTSAAASPTLGRPVALAMLKRSHAIADRVLAIGGERARVVDRPA